MHPKGRRIPWLAATSEHLGLTLDAAQLEEGPAFLGKLGVYARDDWVERSAKVLGFVKAVVLESATSKLAGAKHVHAIEASGIPSVARSLFKANGLSATGTRSPPPRSSAAPVDVPWSVSPRLR